LLKEEKDKLMTQTHSFQILEYIRSTIEIIMNLKVDDMDKNQVSAVLGEAKSNLSVTNDHYTDTSLSGLSV
jgi:hypothetical protein